MRTGLAVSREVCRSPLAFIRLYFQVVRLARVEDELDRIDGDDRRQQRRSRLTARDHVAHAHEVLGDAAADRVRARA